MLKKIFTLYLPFLSSKSTEIVYTIIQIFKFSGADQSESMMQIFFKLLLQDR